MRVLWLLIIMASLFWMLMFSPRTATHVPFWPAMALATAILAGAFFLVERRDWRERFRFEGRHIWIGLVSAAVLYGIFWGGNLLSRQLFESAGAQISAIHGRKEGANLLWVGAALLLWIGPAEEIFWRGFVQHRLMRRGGSTGGPRPGANGTVQGVSQLGANGNAHGVPRLGARGNSPDGTLGGSLAASLPGTLLAALIYAAVHAWSLNLMLVLAALVCGVFWGLLYWWTRSLWPGMISHGVWDVVIFVLAPIGG